MTIVITRTIKPQLNNIPLQNLLVLQKNATASVTSTATDQTDGETAVKTAIVDTKGGLPANPTITPSTTLAIKPPYYIELKF